MTKETLLSIIMADLNILVASQTVSNLLDHLLESSRSYMATEGIPTASGTSENPYDTQDADLIRMYTCYLYRKRSTGEEMPRMLRYALNNRLFSLKARDPDAS